MQAGELGEGGVGVALRRVLHGEAVAGEGVGGIELEDFVERGELVHRLIVRVVRRLASSGRPRICADMHRLRAGNGNGVESVVLIRV